MRWRSWTTLRHPIRSLKTRLIRIWGQVAPSFCRRCSTRTISCADWLSAPGRTAAFICWTRLTWENFTPIPMRFTSKSTARSLAAFGECRPISVALCTTARLATGSKHSHFRMRDSAPGPHRPRARSFIPEQLPAFPQMARQMAFCGPREIQRLRDCTPMQPRIWQSNFSTAINRARVIASGPATSSSHPPLPVPAFTSARLPASACSASLTSRC